MRAHKRLKSISTLSIYRPDSFVEVKVLTDKASCYNISALSESLDELHDLAIRYDRHLYGSHALYALATLSHFESQKTSLRTGDRVRFVALSLVEKITTLVKFIYLALAFLLLVGILLDAV